MSTKTYIPDHYAPLLNLYDTQKAIGLLKRVFEDTPVRQRSICAGSPPPCSWRPPPASTTT